MSSTDTSENDRRSRERESDRYKFGRINKLTVALREWYGWEHRNWRTAALILSAALFWLSMSVPWSMGWQALYAIGVFSLALYLRRFTGTLFTIMMIVFSINASSRYLYWRYTETLSLGTWQDGFFGVALVVAEIYAWLVLVLGYVQTIWPLKRKPEPMPDDVALWPTVDVFIPTYNESLKVVRPTILAAMAIDWPREKLNICLLDDGRREEFREFAARVGVTYITRDNNLHAKAGILTRR